MNDPRESKAPWPSLTPLLTRLGALCETAKRLTRVDGAVVAALMSSESRELVYATDSVAERIDELQFTVGEGPCRDASSSQLPQLCPHINARGPRQRWPALSAGVEDLDIGAIFAFPVPGPLHSLVVLELYRRAAGRLTDAQLNSAHLCAEQIGHTVVSSLPAAASPAETALLAEAALLHPGNPFNRSEVAVAAEMVALQLNVSSDEALARIRAHAYAQNLSVTLAAVDIMAGRLELHV